MQLPLRPPRRSGTREADGLAVASFVLGLLGLLVMNILLGPSPSSWRSSLCSRSTARRGRALLGLALGIADLVVLAVLHAARRHRLLEPVRGAGTPGPEPAPVGGPVESASPWLTSTTRPRPRCSPRRAQALTAQLSVTGNASSLHASGRRARRTVEESRETLAEALGARPSEVVFTSGGTEADNLAVKGLYWSRRAADPKRVRVLASPVEHHAVLDAVALAGRARARGRRVPPRRRAWPGPPRGAARGHRPQPRRRRAGHRDVGQQRDRHPDAGA